MEKTKQKKEMVINSNSRIKGIKNPIFNKVPLEAISSSMTTTKKGKTILFRPNNYRRQIQVKTKSNSTISKIKSAISAIPLSKLNFNKHTKIISIKNYEGITIQYGKDTLTGIYSQNKIGKEKEIFLIKRNTTEELDKRINKITNNIKKRIDYALNKFIRTFKLRIPLAKPKWARYEDFIKGEDYIDKIPREVIIHDTHFKKVYGKGIEFIGNKAPGTKIKNYIKNRSIEDISPEIVDELKITKEMVKGLLEVNISTSKTLNQFVTTFMPLQQDFAMNIKSHTTVIKEMAHGFHKFNKLLSERQKKLGEFV